FFWFGVVRRQLAYGAVELWRAVSGSALIAFAVAIYPIWSYQAGHPYPYLPTFGVPCSTTLFTLGVLAFLETPYPRSIFVAPVLWCVAGSEMAIELPVPQDLSLVVAGIAGMALFICSHGVDPEF
ncbi:MAG TPA: DUF6064 family protein, partial [Pseudomonadales bacterium]|nr:DUF6064 family protein [Pseudomonadales bacterium]